jgi:hypothetical protein
MANQIRNTYAPPVFWRNLLVVHDSLFGRVLEEYRSLPLADRNEHLLEAFLVLDYFLSIAVLSGWLEDEER